MSQARGSQNAGHYYSNIVMPQEIALSFTVAATDSGGLGLTGLKSNGWVRYAFMHTSSTPGVVDGVTNPNPISGVIAIGLKQNFNVFLGAKYSGEATVTGGTVTSLTVGTPYQINSLGTTTTAQWVTAGLPPGFTPAVGQVFVAAATASLGGTGNVKAMTKVGAAAFEILGSPAGTISNSSVASNGGAYLVGQFIDYANALVAPVDGSIINLTLSFDRSSVTVDGL